MPPKNKPKQRIRLTNKAIEAQQFSSVRLPRSSELPAQKVDVDAMYHDRGAAAPAATTTTTGTTSSAAGEAGAGFDPIVNDPMFLIVKDSAYWPPPTLAELQETTGVAVVGVDGFDTYDRRADDMQAKKERVKKVKGELNHPRGKPRVNTIVKLSDSDSD